MPAPKHSVEYLDGPPPAEPVTSNPPPPSGQAEDDGYITGLMAGGVVVWGLLVSGAAGLWLWAAGPEARADVGFSFAVTVAVGASLLGLLCFCASLWLFAGQRRTKRRMARLNATLTRTAAELETLEESYNIEKRDHEATLGAARQLAVRHDALFHAAPYPVVVVQPESRRILFANRRAGDLFGMPPAELSKQRFSVFVPESESYERLLQVIGPREVEEGVQLSIRDAAGAAMAVHAYAIRIDYEGQQAVYLLMADTAPQRKLEEEIAGLRSRVTEQQAELVLLRMRVSEEEKRAAGSGRDMH